MARRGGTHHTRLLLLWFQRGLLLGEGVGWPGDTVPLSPSRLAPAAFLGERTGAGTVGRIAALLPLLPKARGGPASLPPPREERLDLPVPGRMDARSRAGRAPAHSPDWAWDCSGRQMAAAEVQLTNFPQESLVLAGPGASSRAASTLTPPERRIDQTAPPRLPAYCTGAVGLGQWEESSAAPAAEGLMSSPKAALLPPLPKGNGGGLPALRVLSFPGRWAVSPQSHWRNNSHPNACSLALP